MDDAPGRKRARCPGCHAPLVQDYASKQINVPQGFRTLTHYDLLPDDFKGAGPHSKPVRDYAARTWPARNGRWL